MRHPSLGTAFPGFKPIGDDVREYRLELESLARHLLRAPEIGEGSGQGVLLETVAAIPSFRGVDTVRIWLHRTATSETRRLRARRRQGAVDAYLDSVVAGRLDRRRPDSRDLIRDLESRLEVLEALAGLPDNYRCAVLLKEGEGLSVEEVARLMGTTSGSVRSVLYRARHAMREHRGI
jgi:RNA polymerase sigma-70 factor (ECF subfamily)